MKAHPLATVHDDDYARRTWEQTSRGMSPDGKARFALLHTAIEAAVPLRILELRNTPFEERVRLAREGALLIAEKGDVFQFGGGKKGEAKRVFTAVVTGLAIGALQPGGVDAFGLHFCIDHAACIEAGRSGAKP